jgi:hypothetical protein
MVTGLMHYEKLSAMVHNKTGHYNYLKNIGGTDWTPDRFIASS